MATKINLQQLARILAKKKGISNKVAEAFLKEFFDSIVQNVTTDKLVKVKGLGTFKLIEVLDRESVNVNSGERIVIPGHSKLSFTPETALKDLINKPFADFQAVVLNEGTSIEEMERVPEATPDSQLPSDEEPNAVDDEEQEVGTEPVQKLASVQESEEPEPTPEPAPVAVPEPALEPEPASAPEPTPEPAPASEPLAKEEPISLSVPEEKGNRLWYWILGLLLICVLGFVAFKTLSNPSSVEEVVDTEPQVEVPVEAPAPEEQYAQVPNGEYKIVGTLKTHIMKPGEFITRIAIQEYGDKEFAQYIIVHNAFPDPDNVPVDMEIKLPKLQKIE